MDTKRHINELLQRPVTRKQFLQQMGVITLSIFGLSAVLELVLKHRDSSGPNNS